MTEDPNVPTFPLDAKRGHAMMTQEIVDSLPRLGSQDGKGLDAVVHAKWFHVNNWTWLATEGEFEFEPSTYDEDGRRAGCWRMFGLVIGHEVEWGYWDLEELATVEAGFGNLPVERDCWFQPQPLRDIIAESFDERLRQWAYRLGYSLRKSQETDAG